MKHFFKKCLYGVSISALALAGRASAAEAEMDPPMIDLSNNVSEIQQLKIDEDASLTTTIRTDWEIPMAVGEANDNGHALFCRGRYVYTYLNRYGTKANPIIRQYDAENSDLAPVEREPRLNDLDDIWVNGNLVNHIVMMDDNGRFLFVLGDRGLEGGATTKIKVVGYDFDNDKILYVKEVEPSGNYTKMLLHASSMSFARGTLTGDIEGAFEAGFVVLGTEAAITYCVPVSVSGDGNTVSVVKGNALVNYKAYVEPVYTDICDVDNDHMVVTHLSESELVAGGIGRVALFENYGGYFNHVENWSGDLPGPGLSIADDQLGYCFGMNVVRHDGHNLMVYARSYIGEVVYNVAVWDNPARFDNMRLIARVKVPGNVVTGNVYKEGIRQLAVRSESAASRESDHNSSTTFYTYAPGAALARHTITTESEKVQTGVSQVGSEGGLTLEGRVVRTSGTAPVAVYDAYGRLVAERAAAGEVSLDGLAPGFYIVRSGSETLKAVLE